LRLAAAAAAVAALLLGGCGLSRALHEARAVSRPAVRGELVLEGPGGERARFAPDACATGEREGFRGYLLSSAESGAVARAVADPLGGGGVRISGLPGAAPRDLVVRAAQCDRFELEVANSGWRVDDFWDLDGYLNVHCAVENGWRLAGRIEVEHCH
jgi:hypothetical protein